MHAPGKYRGHHITQLSTETAGEGFRRRDGGRVEFNFGKEQQDSGRGEEQQTGCTS